MKGKPNWEHLNDELHVLVTVEDTKNRGEIKLRRAVEEIKRLLIPAVSVHVYACITVLLVHLTYKENKIFINAAFIKIRVLISTRFEIDVATV